MSVVQFFPDSVLSLLLFLVRVCGVHNYSHEEAKGRKVKKQVGEAINFYSRPFFESVNELPKA